MKTAKIVEKLGISALQISVGSLPYLVKQSRPDIANSVREFSKVMDCAIQSHSRELLRMVKYGV
jgi:hypothetical protein